MPYRMRGQFLESCDCEVPCPCWFEQDPDANECTGLVAWQIEQGEIDGLDVSGLTAVSVSHHGGNRKGARMRLALFVDERASEQQKNALVRAFTGELGGPLGELAEMIDEFEGEQTTKIEFTSDGATTTVNVGDGAVAGDMKPLVGPTGRIVTVADGMLSTLLGTPGEVGSGRLTLDMEGRDFDLDIGNRSATRGRFSYLHE